MHVGIAADHGGFALKQEMIANLKQKGFDVTDYGAYQLEPTDDYPDFAQPLAVAVSNGNVERGILICGSGVGACIAANKVIGARAALITDTFSAHQGVEDDNMNIICLGGRVIGPYLAYDIVNAFLSANYVPQERFERRLNKIKLLEAQQTR